MSPASRFIRCIKSRAVIDRAHGFAGAEQIAAHREMFGQASDLQQRLRRAADVRDRLQ
jgi:hypothetical protein